MTRLQCAPVLLAVSLLAVAGCTKDSSPGDAQQPTVAGGTGTPATSSPTAGRSVLDCGAASGELPDEGRTVVFDAVALPDPATTSALQAWRQSGTSRPLERFFAKDGLSFKVGSEWSLTVSPEDLTHVRIGWGSPPTPGTVVRSPVGCRVPADAEWMWYPGGYWTDKPGCYSVVVQVGVQEQRVDVGIGEPCPGQEPPVIPPSS